MAKSIRTTVKRKLNLKGLMVTLFLLTGLCAFVTTTFVSQNNVQLSKKIQDANKEAKAIFTENETLRISVQELKQYNHVVSIAKDAGLSDVEGTITVRRGE